MNIILADNDFNYYQSIIIGVGDKLITSSACEKIFGS